MNLEEMSREDLLKIMARDRMVKQSLTERVAGLTAENAELIAICNELDSDLAEARQALQVQQQPDG